MDARRLDGALSQARVEERSDELGRVAAACPSWWHVPAPCRPLLGPGPISFAGWGLLQAVQRAAGSAQHSQWVCSHAAYALPMPCPLAPGHGAEGLDALRPHPGPAPEVRPRWARPAMDEPQRAAGHAGSSTPPRLPGASRSCVYSVPPLLSRALLPWPCQPLRCAWADPLLPPFAVACRLRAAQVNARARGPAGRRCWPAAGRGCGVPGRPAGARGWGGRDCRRVGAAGRRLPPVPLAGPAVQPGSGHADW